MKRIAFVLATVALAFALGWIEEEVRGRSFLFALLASLAVVAWSSFALPLARIAAHDQFYRLWPWEASGRFYRRLGVHAFRRIVRRGPLSVFNRSLRRAWRSGDPAAIEHETRIAEAAHGIAFLLVIALAAIALVRGDPRRAAWLAVLDVPLNLYPSLLQRDHRLRLQQALSGAPDGDGGSRREGR